jgi:TolB-like protein/Tfp pilus assembly protein PilF
MSDTGKAVFLSYASQDADAARRICEALRAAGVEVWFDQSELVGGDAWDQKIRKHIKECTLLIPVISAATQARTEGYFRLEWRLADQRTHLMAKGRPFLLPVVIDETRDAEAHVPDSFTEVQWTRLPSGESPPAFVARVKKLLSAEMETGRPRPAERDEGVAAPMKSKSKPSWLWVLLALVVAVPAYFIFKPRRSPEEIARMIQQAQTFADNATKPSALPAGSEIGRLRSSLRPDEWTRADFDAFIPVTDRLIQANPENGEAWALRSIAHSLLVVRNLDTGTKPLEAGKEAADRALRLAPDSPLAELSLGLHLVAMISRDGDPLACRVPMDRALAGLPANENLTRYAELCSYWLGYQFEGTEKSARAWLTATPGASFPAWILAQSALVRRRPEEALKWSAQASADPEITGVRSFVTAFEACYYLQADLAAAQAALDRVPAGQRSVHRVLASRWLVAMAEKHFDQALQELNRAPEAMLRDRVYHGPKVLLAGLANEAAGRSDVAQAQFGEAERILHLELTADPDNQELRAVLALTLACQGRSDEARRELAAVEPLLTGQDPTVYTGHLIALIAQVHGVLGEMDRMVPWLRILLTKPSQVPFTPASLRQDPRFGRYVAEPLVRALLAEFAAPETASTTAAGGGSVADKSVAVLAFANLSDDKANEYFSDGISEELLTVLQKIPGLKVTARTSAFYFKGKNEPVAEIARQLGVAYVVEGSVRKAGAKVRIAAQLIKAADGFEVWSDHFDRELTDVFAVQDEIAGVIARNFQLKLGEAPHTERVVNPEAHQLYLQGKYFLNQFSVESAARAAGLLQRSIELDPSFAPAWVGLAFTGIMRGGYGSTRQDVEEGFASARRAAERALALDPDLAIAHVALANVQQVHDFNWKGAAESLHRAQALEPANADVIDGLASLAYTFGQLDRTVALDAQAVALDPVNTSVRVDYGFSLCAARRFPEAEAEFRRTIELNPAALWGHAGLSFNFTVQGRYDEAAAEAGKEGNEWSRLFTLALAQWGQKKVSESDANLARLIKVYGDVAAYQVAEAYAFRHDNDHAFEWLERAYRQRDPGLSWLRPDPLLGELRKDPRWEPLLRKLGLADDQLP